MTMHEELEDIEAQIKALEERKREIYRESIEAPDHLKVCVDSIAKITEADVESVWYVQALRSLTSTKP